MRFENSIIVFDDWIFAILRFELRLFLWRSKWVIWFTHIQFVLSMWFLLCFPFLLIAGTRLFLLLLVDDDVWGCLYSRLILIPWSPQCWFFRFEAVEPFDFISNTSPLTLALLIPSTLPCSFGCYILSIYSLWLRGRNFFKEGSL